MNRIEGMICVGQIANRSVNNGAPVPLFQTAEPEGRPDINSKEGWNKIAREANQRVFADMFGRQPVCDDELKAWVKSKFEKTFCWKGNT